MVKDKVFSVLRRDEVMLYISVPLQVITRWPHSSDKLAHIILLSLISISLTQISSAIIRNNFGFNSKFTNFLEGPPSPSNFLSVVNENLFYFDHSLISQ